MYQIGLLAVASRRYTNELVLYQTERPHICIRPFLEAEDFAIRSGKNNPGRV
jgi:hypothetical protein